MDTFPLMPIRNQEPLIIERLRIAFPEKIFTIERVPQVLSLKQFNRIATQTPYIGVAWTGMKPDADNGRMLKGNMLWRLILVSGVSSGLEARLKGDKYDIGMDAMVDVASVLLQGVNFDGQGVTSITLANSVIADGWSDDNIAIAQIDFTFSFATSAAATGKMQPEDFKALGITWSVNGSTETVTDEVQPPQE
ncbi:hypothetical protein FY148_07985 [Agrobacterium tumefaciens]|uniref:hypothetical protein n=1 Tax=Agrobacterium tumefaciens TaxID=358 RepID=UPI0021D10A35|nr:hypothetical protein [Agrobacterium tumefaciens]UXS52591.1 hypothetical protein FY148_07985 [Agrobacterium tumefaciens]UXS62837.1 hypothetical protein FY147_07985 [Agrobacterium tumefaciens]